LGEGENLKGCECEKVRKREEEKGRGGEFEKVGI
jgi:hypothetical protein